MTLTPEQIKAKEYLDHQGSRRSATQIAERVAAGFVVLEEFLAGVSEADARTRPIEGEWTIQEVVDHLVETHRLSVTELRELLAGRFGPDVVTDDAVAAAGYVREKTSLAATLPGPADGRSVVGARLCFFHGAPVGLVIYRLRGEPASLFLVPDAELGRFQDMREGSAAETGMVAITRPVPGGKFAVVAVGSAAAREQVERLAMEVASK